MYVTPKEAQKYYKVSRDTLRRWADKEKISFKITEGGHRRYAIEEKKETRKKIIYARVSSKKQERDLQRQIRVLKNKYPSYRIIKDIGSGINYKRKGFKTLLELILSNDVEEIVVYSKDRLSRFSMPLIEDICQHYNTKITIVSNESNNKSEQEEFAEDIISIITVFTARVYGRRKYKNS